MNNEKLIISAIESLENSHSPYSEFRVGAALLTDDDVIYTGCNIENASYSATVCAERTAFFKAISEGKRSFKKIAIVGKVNGNDSKYIPPCGICRQVMSEFCNNDFEIIIAKNSNDYKILKLSQLLPYSFSKKDLGE